MKYAFRIELIVSIVFLFIVSGGVLRSQENTSNQMNMADYFQLNRTSMYKFIPDSIRMMMNLDKENMLKNKHSFQKKLTGESESKNSQKNNEIRNILNRKNDNWPRIYHDEINAPNLNMLVSYDHGYLLTGRIKPNYPRYNWLIKTDINGDVLWEKTIGNGINTIVSFGMGMNREGSLYLSGLTAVEDPYGDPFILKLNECGDKEWCKIFYLPGTQNSSYALVVTPDGGCAALLFYTGENGFIDRNCLVRFDKDGNKLWQQCYNSQDSLLGIELCYDLILTPDRGFLMTGYCFYTDTVHNLSWDHPYYIKTDSLGNFEWETVPDKQGINGFGAGWSTVISPDNKYYYSSISHYYYYSEENGSAPALLILDMNGVVKAINDVKNPNDFGKLFESRFISDSTLVSSATWGNAYSHLPKAVIIDTAGNMLNEQFLLDNEYLAYVRTTIDNKYLFYTQDIDENEEFDAYLFKLNQKLESDTVYTQYFTYDSLCDGVIVSDTIVQDDCGIIVGNVELYKPKEENRLLIYPNPAGERITIECLLFENENCKLEIVDQQGRKITALKVMKGEREIIIDATGWQPGFYVVRVISDAEVLSGKVVVHR